VALPWFAERLEPAGQGGDQLPGEDRWRRCFAPNSPMFPSPSPTLSINT
jgi:hypothetical protein